MADDRKRQRHGNASTMPNQENPINSVPSIQESSTSRVSYFALGLTLKDIPSPTPCSYCGASTQKELLDYEVKTDSLVIAASPAPGYGCTECGGKMFAPKVFLKLLEGAAKEARKAGEAHLIKYLQKEIALHKSVVSLANDSAS